ncbi:299_t:CDS:2 [Funneliformis caledonium]|uniref:299_t:CDS:1 n=1 Tax=Funneliformis caledonium TaxID=1117310 RepID=A0A9N9DJD8_9GLOM|nr:299_t:CDS:2 [Funneliformis caledonium]
MDSTNNEQNNYYNPPQTDHPFNRYCKLPDTPESRNMSWEQNLDYQRK